MEAKFGWLNWTNTTTEKIATIYHECAHIILGIPFLLVPQKVVFWNKAGDKISFLGKNIKPQGYVRQIGYGIPSLIGGYFSGAAPVLLLMILSGASVSNSSLGNPFYFVNTDSKEMFSNHLYYEILITLKQYLVSIIHIFRENLIALVIFGFFFGFFIRGARLSQPDLLIVSKGSFFIIFFFGLMIFCIVCLPNSYFGKLIFNFLSNHFLIQKTQEIQKTIKKLFIFVSSLEIITAILSIVYLFVHGCCMAAIMQLNRKIISKKTNKY